MIKSVKTHVLRHIINSRARSSILRNVSSTSAASQVTKTVLPSLVGQPFLKDNEWY